MQVLLIYFFTDILQRAQTTQLLSVDKENGPENVPLNDLGHDECWDQEEEEELDDKQLMVAGHVILERESPPTPPLNLHSLGVMFLGQGLRQIFDAILLVQFMALLISYALAGSQAYAEVMNIRDMYVIPVFVWILAFAIIFALQIIQPVVSLLTFAKGSLLLATVVVTFFVGAAIHHEVKNDFTYSGESFLMGTVALGGIVNVMPFLYGKIKPIETQVRGFRRAILGGLTTCMILNVLWCWAVLEIVPQQNTCFTYLVRHNNSFHSVADTQVAPRRQICSHNLSMESAREDGQISTIPLTQIIHQLYPAYDWVALLVEVFIMISITVSYLTIGAAMHHTLGGWVDSLWRKDQLTHYMTRVKQTRKCSLFNSECLCRCFLSLSAFLLIFIVAMLNPKGFESMLEKIASLFINLEAGLFVFLMIRKASSGVYGQVMIPLPLSPVVVYLQFTIPLYFLFAVFYDGFTTVYDTIYGNIPLPWEHKHVIGNTVLVSTEDFHSRYLNSTNLPSTGN
ncbi:hypothetical protein NP493_53g19016 [Ridgeia piscesae]|uniref:Uncharacterized protein n=1 Tax=Ridgeia piscesae TaxID=27915 RepID=A0AAD9UJ64_RIDPI|nr:hypothetical protein NP493_53g19016 [Ridgeia piscesae]